MLFCQMLLVDPGANQPVLIYEEGKEGFQIDAVSTKELTQEKLKQNSDFVNSMLYFGVKGNEVVVMASQAITVRALEVHLAWLLRNRPDVLPANVSFALVKHPPCKLEEVIQQHPVKSVEIGSPIVAGEKIADGDKYLSSDTVNLGLNTLRTLLGVRQASWLDGITDESNLSARIVITYSRNTDEAGRDVMNKLGTTLRNLDDADVRLSLDGLGVMTGDDLNLSKWIKVEKTERGLFVETDIYMERECLDFCVQGGFQGGSQSRLPFVYRGLKINDQRLRGTLSRRHKCAKRGECGAPSGGFHHTLHHSIALVNRSPNSRANCGMADDHLVLARVQVSV